MEKENRNYLLDLEPMNRGLIQRFLKEYPAKLSRCRTFLDEVVVIDNIFGSKEYSGRVILTEKLKYDLWLAEWRCNQSYGLKTMKYDKWIAGKRWQSIKHGLYRKKK